MGRRAIESVASVVAMRESRKTTTKTAGGRQARNNLPRRAIIVSRERHRCRGARGRSAILLVSVNRERFETGRLLERDVTFVKWYST